MALKTAKDRLFLFIALVVLLPLLNYHFHFESSGGLQGVYNTSKDTTFTPEGWWSGGYQEEKTKFLNDSVGFHPDLVRLNNQMDYWLFGKVHGNDVYLGKDQYLIDLAYVNEYYGVDFSGDDAIRRNVMMLKKIQDTMAKLGKTFIVAYAPSKVYVLPDKVPYYLRFAKGPLKSNYRSYSRIGDSVGLKQIDFNAWFIKNYNAEHNRIIPKLGAHWSLYGALLAGDSLTSYIEHERHIKMPRVKITEMRYSDTPQHCDNDLASITNLIYPITKEQLPYPKYTYVSDSSTQRPKMIYIGDSYIWPLIYNNYMHNVNSYWLYWNYFSEVWDDAATYGGPHPPDISHRDWHADLMNTDVVLLMYVPYNLWRFNLDDFVVHEMYYYFFPSEKK